MATIKASDLKTGHVIRYNGEWCKVYAIYKWPHGEVMLNLKVEGCNDEIKAKCKSLDMLTIQNL